jgi:hypothetical protein
VVAPPTSDAPPDLLCTSAFAHPPGEVFRGCEVTETGGAHHVGFVPAGAVPTGVIVQVLLGPPQHPCHQFRAHVRCQLLRESLFELQHGRGQFVRGVAKKMPFDDAPCLLNGLELKMIVRLPEDLPAISIRAVLCKHTHDNLYAVALTRQFQGQEGAQSCCTRAPLLGLGDLAQLLLGHMQTCRKPIQLRHSELIDINERRTALRMVRGPVHDHLDRRSTI